MPDTTSGFRAYNREAALQLQVVSKFTYTLETIIQAGKMTVAIDHVPIRTNAKTRESRLFPSMWSVRAPQRRSRSSASTRCTSRCGLHDRWRCSSALVALAVWTRFLVACVQGDGAGHVQSLILGAVLFNAAVVLAALGVIGDLLSGQRIMLQRMFERVRRLELHLEIPPSHYEPGGTPSSKPPTTGAERRRRGHTEEREAVQL